MYEEGVHWYLFMISLAQDHSQVLDHFFQEHICWMNNEELYLHVVLGKIYWELDEELKIEVVLVF